MDADANNDDDNESVPDPDLSFSRCERWAAIPTVSMMTLPF